jgi:hypothetical protein
MLTEKVSLGPAGKDRRANRATGGPEAIESAILVTSGAFLGDGRGFHHWRRERGFGEWDLGRFPASLS